MDKLKGAIVSKTMWFGFFVVVLGFMQDHIPDAISPEYQGLVSSGIGFLIMVLRTVTDKPLEAKGNQSGN